MGEMIRQHYWIPAVPASKLVADGAPIRVRLLGGNYVAFRATDGRVGVIDEQCPHRRASLALAHNEENGLRCLYHGWKINVARRGGGGAQPRRRPEAVLRARARQPLRRAWSAAASSGSGSARASRPPKFPELPFVDLPDAQRAVTSQEVPTNWVQAVEASMDSSHVGVLHESTTQITAGGGNERVLMTQALAPKLEFEDRPYGYRYAALRALPDDKVYARVNNFVMPWYGIICPPDAKGPSTVFFSTPVDDVTHRAWFVHFNPHRPLGMTVMSASPDVWNFPPLPPGDAAGQLGPEPRPDEARPRHRLPAAPGHRGLRDVPQPGPDPRPHRRSNCAPPTAPCCACASCC